MSSHPRPRVWTAAAVAAGATAGLLFVTSAINSHGVDLRGSSVTDLTSLLMNERGRARDLQDRIAAVNAQVSALSKSSHDRRVKELQPDIDNLKVVAGFTAASGPGVTVTLTDAPKSMIDKVQQNGEVPVDALLVHQQDIQGVVNALWAGGATAISIQDQRIISTTGIKCVGNTVVLHGVPYSPPYVIRAVGEVRNLIQALDDSEYVQSYKTFVSTYQLGWSMEVSSNLEVPAYTGASDLTWATVDTTPVEANNIVR